MRKVILFGLLLCMGVATASGQKSTVQVFGVPFGSTYDEFLAAFNEKGFEGQTYIYEGGSDVEVSSIYGTLSYYIREIVYFKIIYRYGIWSFRSFI